MNAETEIEDDGIEAEETAEETDAETLAEGEGAGDGDADGDAVADEGDEEDEEEDGDEALGQRAQKRIKKLNGKRKEAERRVAELEAELEEARKVGGDGAEIYVAAAKAAGILPSMMTKDLAEGLAELDRKEGALRGLSGMLDSDDDEFTIGETTYSRRQVERREARLRGEVQELKETYGGKRKELQRKVRAIFDLGMKASKAGWKPGAKTVTEKRQVKQGPEADGKGAAKGGKRMAVDYRDVGSADDLDAMITEMRRKGS